MKCQKCKLEKKCVTALVFMFKNFTITPPRVVEQKYNMCKECKDNLYETRTINQLDEKFSSKEEGVVIAKELMNG